MRFDKIVFGILVSSHCLFGVNALVNGSFEQPVLRTNPPSPVKRWFGGKIATYHDYDVNGWETTATDHEIEFWSAAVGDPFEGNQFIELNANQVAAVYQDVPTIPGKKFNWFVAHRGRSGVDTARVLMGPPNGPLHEVRIMKDNNSVWGAYLGSYEVPSGQTITRLQFEAVSTATGNDTVGNFLDGFKVGPVLQYKMDECYWLGSGIYDVYDSSLNGADGESLNGASVINDSIINSAGSFDGSDDYISIDDDGALDLNQTFTLTMWLKPSSDDSTVLIDHSHKTSSRYGTTTIDKGWLLSYNKSSYITNAKVSFEMAIDGTIESVEIEPDGWNDSSWHFVSVVYDGSELKLRVDDVNNTTSNLSGSIDNASSSLLCIASSQGGGDYYSGLIDEVKIFAVALGDDEIATLKANDLAGNNYTGIKRDSVVCDASIAGHTWDLIGIPADFRNSSNTKTTIKDIFDDDMNGTYGADWRVYRREYNMTDNNSSYVFMDIKDELKFGAGYWLGSKLNSIWSENGAVSVDYNSSTNGTDDCPAERCVEIPMTSVILDKAIEDLKNSGPYRFFMTGFVGKQPIKWSDCRLIISNQDGSNQQILTPSGAENAGYVSKEIWQYNPSSSNVDAKGYATCDDVTPGSCKLIPYKGFWIEILGHAKGKSVKLLIPKE